VPSVSEDAKTFGLGSRYLTGMELLL